MAINGEFSRRLNQISNNLLTKNHCLSEQALQEGTWVKLICGASNQDLPSIFDLCAVYATAGVHCIDVAADEAVVFAARQALDWVEERKGVRPWLMISLSDGKDAHFRKAWFDPEKCPGDCSRPCQNICPAKAIPATGGVMASRCYGCGRCISSCPLGIIQEEDRRLGLKDFAPLIKELRPDAVEVHTAPGRIKEFQSAVSELVNANVSLKRLGVSCGLQGTGLTYRDLADELWERYLFLQRFGQKPLWQLDGRRMSGDLGKGAAFVAVALWREIRDLAPPGPLQLAGGTNNHTIEYLPKSDGPAGIAFGGMARKLIQPLLLEAQERQISLTDWPEGWQKALDSANKLINPWLSRKYELHFS